MTTPACDAALAEVIHAATDATGCLPLWPGRSSVVQVPTRPGTYAVITFSTSA
jgi:hypothetical protein